MQANGVRRLSSLPIVLSLLAAGIRAQGFTPGHLFVTDASGLVLEFAADRSFVRSFTSAADFGSSPAQGLAFRPDGTLEVAAAATDKLVTFDATGTKAGETAGGTLASPQGLAIGPNGERWVARLAAQDVEVLDATGAPRRIISGGNAPRGLAFGPNGHLFLADDSDDTLYEFDPDGDEIANRATGASSAPFGVACGPDGLLYVTRTSPPAVLGLDASGIVSTLTHASITTPRGIAFGFDGRLYVANESPPEVLRIKITPGNAVVQSIADPAMTGPLFLAFAPMRFRASVSARLQTGGGPVRVKDVYDPTSGTGPVLTVTPEGAFLRLFDDPLDALDLASVLGVSEVGWRGTSVTNPAGRTFAGGQLSVYGDLLGTATLSGALVFDSTTAELVTKSIRGSLVFHLGDSLLVGTLKGKRLP